MRRLADLRSDTIACASDGRIPPLPMALFCRWPDHPAAPVEILDRCGTRVSGEAIPVTSVAHKYGKDTIEVLLENGISDTEIASLLAKGVVSTGWSESYMIG